MSFKIYVYEGEQNFIGKLYLPCVPHNGEYIRIGARDFLVYHVLYEYFESDSRTIICVASIRREYEKQISEDENESTQQNQQDCPPESQTGQTGAGPQSVYEAFEEDETPKFTKGQLRAAKIIIALLWLFVWTAIIVYIINNNTSLNPTPPTQNTEQTPDAEDSIRIPIIPIPEDPEPAPPPKRKGIYL